MYTHTHTHTHMNIRVHAQLHTRTQGAGDSLCGAGVCPGGGSELELEQYKQETRELQNQVALAN